MGGFERDQVVAAFPAARFPALAGFVRGYLHVDFADEHGSPEAAGQAFARVASPAERARLREEWREFSSLTAELADADVIAILIRRFGCGWQAPSPAQVSRVMALAGSDPAA